MQEIEMLYVDSLKKNNSFFLTGVLFNLWAESGRSTNLRIFFEEKGELASSTSHWVVCIYITISLFFFF